MRYGTKTPNYLDRIKEDLEFPEGYDDLMSSIRKRGVSNRPVIRDIQKEFKFATSPFMRGINQWKKIPFNKED